MKILIIKGSILTIKISIKTKIIHYEPSIEYYLDGKKIIWNLLEFFYSKLKIIL
jgi:hypothetical protein